MKKAEVLSESVFTTKINSGRRSFRVGIISQVQAALKGCFEESAVQAAQEAGVIHRQRKFSAVSLAQTFVLGLLSNPRATTTDLAGTAALAGVDVSPQAIEKRFTPELADFLKNLFISATQKVVASSETMAPILERFTSVILLDSSGVRLPESEAENFKGNGGTNGIGKAALKLQTELDLRSGALNVQLEHGKDPDGASSRQHIDFVAGSLRVTDLGYFCMPVFAAIAAANAYFLSRIQHTTITWVNGERVGNIVEWLNTQTQTVVEQSIEVGAKHRLPCRLVAWKVPEQQVNLRRRRARLEASRRGRTATKATLAACEWTFLITNASEELLSTKEVIVMYRSRWQIELLFKRWKSTGLIAELHGKNDPEQMVRLWAKFCAALIQHWLTVMVAWESESTWSFDRIAKRVRSVAEEIIEALTGDRNFTEVLEGFKKRIKRIAHRNPRKKTGTFELLRNPNLLDYALS